MFFTIPENFKTVLAKYGTPQNAYVFLLILRRKWLINIGYLPEKEAKKLFPSSEMCLGKCIISGDLKGIDYKLNRMLSILTETAPKTMTFKGNTYYIPELYQKYPLAFSLMITIQPRDLIRATKNITKKIIEVFMINDNIQQLHLAQHIDQEWVSQVQKCSDNKNPMMLVDIDIALDKTQIEMLNNYFFDSKNPQNNYKNYFVYGCKTPSKGVHLIFEINETTGNIFKYQREFKKSLAEYIKIDPENIEINSMKNKLTHVPGFNKLIKPLTIN